MSVQDIDRGWKRIVNRCAIKRSYVKIGVQQGETRKDEEGETSSMVVVAAVNEFGAPSRNIPERPFMRTTFDTKKEQLATMQRALLSKLVTGEMYIEQALGLLGLEYTRQVQNTIDKWTTPPNAPSTQKAKGAKVGPGVMVNNPLVDTSQLIQSIRHVVVVK